MPSLKDLKLQIKSVKSTKKITTAMKMVARLAMLATKKYKISDVVNNVKTVRECFPSNKLSNQLQNRYHVWKEIVNVNKAIAKNIMNVKYE